MTVPSRGKFSSSVQEEEEVYTHGKHPYGRTTLSNKVLLFILDILDAL
jgi:hypothetical protein